MNRLRWYLGLALTLTLWLVAPTGAWAQRVPDIGYIYPAGVRQGTTAQIAVGGQYVNGVKDAYVTGAGVTAEVVEYIKPISRKHLNDLRNKLRELNKQRKDEKINLREMAEQFKAFAEKLGLKDMDLAAFRELGRRLRDPKRQPNPQIEETVILRLTVSPDAEPGRRQLRLRTGRGVTNPLFFQVGQYAEYREQEPNDVSPGEGLPQKLPVIINGQIMPGDVDRFRFQARKGMRLVAAVAARRLIPYLADAVPGWFQATLTVTDARGKEVAYADDFRFDPDPVICFEVPADGEYVLQIHDAIYRGREDFVYRITLGEVPFVTSVYPLGGKAGGTTRVRVEGWNLPDHAVTVDATDHAGPVRPISVRKGGRVSNHIPFALDALPQSGEMEPNNDRLTAQRVRLPLIVNGRIDRAGDRDVFRYDGRAGEVIVAAVQARTLGSPLDSLLKLTNADGRLLAANDDCEDKCAGLTTHQADSHLRFRLPSDGTYLIHLSDTQKKGGTAYAYRLRISPPRPDFALRLVPSTINARAGMAVPIIVHAVRRDGFDGPITLRLRDMPKGFLLSGARIPPGHDKVRLTVTVPHVSAKEPVNLQLEGCATIDGKRVCRPAVPAEDMMQAFLYRHLVPVEDCMVLITGRRRFGPPLKVVGGGPARIPVGGSAEVRIAAPRGPMMQQVKLELNDPPKGITIRKSSSDAKGLLIVLAADGEAIEPGLEGNLIVSAFIERTFKRKGSTGPGRKRRVPLGALPAIRFQVVAPDGLAAGKSS